MSNCMGETTKVNSLSFFSSFSIFPLPAAFHSLFIDHGWDWSYLLQNYVLYMHFFVPQIIEFYAKTRYYAQMLTINVCNQHFITLIRVTKVKSLRIPNTRKRCYLPSGPFKAFFLFFRLKLGFTWRPAQKLHVLHGVYVQVLSTLELVGEINCEAHVWGRC